MKKLILGHVSAYIALQRIVGADRLRYRCLDEVALTAGERVVDVGCGPAYYFDRLPQPIEYHGYDTDARYIDWARQRWGAAGHFHHGTFDREACSAHQEVDAVLLLGVLHHLSDDASTDLFDAIGRVLAPSGRVVAVDTCFEPSQGRLSRWMAENDRGEFVRTPDEFEHLAQDFFGSVRGELLDGTTRIPGSYWMMTMAAPRSSAADGCTPPVATTPTSNAPGGDGS